jgi:hypothetical protein
MIFKKYLRHKNWQKLAFLTQNAKNWIIKVGFKNFFAENQQKWLN